MTSTFTCSNIDVLVGVGQLFPLVVLIHGFEDVIATTALGKGLERINGILDWRERLQQSLMSMGLS